jgi:outer membrane lipoprotein-sorting protein
MNCSQCREDFAAYQEGLLVPESQSQITAHLADCPSCRAEFDQLQSIVARLTHTGLGTPGRSLETHVMDRIIHDQALTIRRLQMRKRIRLLGIGGVLTAAVALFFILGLWATQPDTQARAAEAKVQAAEILAQCAKALPKISSIHIKGKMRNAPYDNFINLDPKLEFAPIEIWKQFGDNAKWRVEKPGRVIVMDGSSTIQLIKPPFNTAIKIPKPSEDAFDTYWLFSFANVPDLVNRQLQSALAKGWDMNLTYEQDKGLKDLLVTVEAKSAKDADDYLKNDSIDTSDTRRAYRFDAETKLLKAIQIYMHLRDQDVLVFEADKIEYDQPIAPATFTLELPKDVKWYKEPTKLADNEKYEKMTPKEAAAAFFEACSKENWDELQKFSPMPVDERFKQFLGGLQVISLGEPFQAKPYPGWFVPYEIKFKNGESHKHNLAVRNDNPVKRYMFDGGL